ncbi:MAG: VWA domain-containing protein [Bacteroidales bacterium]|nr:VWA domain-containing protein [Bacteroidales bacterium]
MLRKAWQGNGKSDKKINIARRMLIQIIDSLEQLDNVSLGLRLYGHQSPVPPQDCSDTRLEVPFSKGNAGRIRQELRFINPKGTTPMTESLRRGGEDFPPDCDNCRNIIILITDGIEACDGDPCDASRELQKNGIVLKPFIIGIGIDEQFMESFKCIGHFYNAADEENFKNVLNIVITQALNETTAQVNLLDSYGRPSETDVNLSFIDQLSGRVKQNYIHTINHAGNPDTLVLDHLLTYRLRVNTLPPVEVDNIKLAVGKHTIIAAKAPQGILVVKPSGSNQYRDIKFLVRMSGNGATLNYQELNRPEKYIIGKYDLEIPVLPKLLIEGVEIKQSYTTTVEIPRPGIATFLKPSRGYGSVYVKRNNDLEWVVNLNPEIENETFVLLPGNYLVVYRAKNAKQSIYSVQKNFEIVSGSSKAISFFKA